MEGYAGLVNCPYVECETIIKQAELLKNHQATVPNLNLQVLYFEHGRLYEEEDYLILIGVSVAVVLDIRMALP